MWAKPSICKNGWHPIFSARRPISAKTALMVSRVADIETVVTASEKEALILESNLIKRHRPVSMWFSRTISAIRRFVLTSPPPIRKLKSSANTQRRRRVFWTVFIRLGRAADRQADQQNLSPRKCSDRTLANRTRPCIHHQMGQCLAPCCLRSTERCIAPWLKKSSCF
jgi:excinuclease ABC subunit C